MIYQHRLVVARGGRLEKRHAAFQKEAMTAFEEYGSVLIGAWEVWVGTDAGCAVYQLRQFESLDAWQAHRESVLKDSRFSKWRQGSLYPYNDFVDTSIVVPASGMAPLPESWPSVEQVRGQPRGYLEQRIIYLRPDKASDHHRFYFEQLAPALEKQAGELVALFDTMIGAGSSTASSHRSIELRRFSSMSEWQSWREAQESDETLSRLVKEEWLARVERVESALLRPLDYSRIR